MNIMLLHYTSGRQPFFMMAQILSLEISEGPAVHLKHTAVITITCITAKVKHTIVPK